MEIHTNVLFMLHVGVVPRTGEVDSAENEKIRMTREKNVTGHFFRNYDFFPERENA